MPGRFRSAATRSTVFSNAISSKGRGWRRPVGIVTEASAQRVYWVKVNGVEGHAGTVPMAERRDALLGAARMVDALHGLAVRTDDAMVLTIGAFDVIPNGRSTIPGEVVFAVDNRHPKSAVLNERAKEIDGLCKHIAGDLGLDVEISKQSRRDEITFDVDLNYSLRTEAKRLGLGYLELSSGAGHDACKLAPTTMVFTPCRGGFSHREDKWAEPDDLEAGATLLLRAFLTRRLRRMGQAISQSSLISQMSHMARR
jgi:N-carbamoyl-L-amino-acid hydrolase